MELLVHAAPTATRRHRRRLTVVVTDQLGERFEESFFGHTAAVDLPFDADHSLRMPDSPHTSMPCDHDCRMVIRTIPREP